MRLNERSTKFWLPLGAALLVGLPYAPASVAKAKADRLCEVGLKSNGVSFAQPLFPQFFGAALDHIGTLIPTNAAQPLGAVATGGAPLESDKLRAQFFRLIALTEIYRDTDPKTFDKVAATFLELEEAFGNAAQMATYIDEAKVGEMPPELIERLNAKQQKLDGKLAATLDNLRWTTSDDDRAPGVQKVADAIDSVKPWNSTYAERRYVLKELISQIQELEDDVADGVYTKSAIEEGLHKLRRKIRKIIIRFGALSGLTARSDEDVPAAAEVLYQTAVRRYSDLPNDKYIKLPAATADWQIRIPYKLHAILSYYVDRLGHFKDAIEAEEFFGPQLDGLGVYKKAGIQSEINDLLARNHLPNANLDTKAIARDTQAELTSAKVLKILRKSLEAQL